jgi:hypothetical protein
MIPALLRFLSALASVPVVPGVPVIGRRGE